MSCTRHILISLLPLFAVACRSVPEPQPSWIRLEERRWDELANLKAELWPRAFDPVDFDFPGRGHVHVRRWFLEGGPGWEYLRARFTYQNTTDKEIDEVMVSLVITSKDGQHSSIGRVRLVHPFGWTLKPGTFFADEVRAETHGIHWGEGWQWAIEVEARERNVPGEPVRNPPAK